MTGEISPVGATALWIAADRAIETESTQPLFSDPLARSLAGDLGFRVMAQLSPANAGFRESPLLSDPYLSVRTRFFDDALVGVTAEQGIRQVLLLAAGMDTRAFRLSWPDGTIIYEIDRDDVFSRKESILGERRAAAACERRVVSTDLSEDWTGALLAAGFDTGLPAAILAEGFVMYLPPGVVAGLMTGIASVAADGSWLGFDAANPELLSSSLTSATLARLYEFGAPFLSAMADPELSLATHGWRANVTSPDQPDASYGRWPFRPIPLTVPGIPRALFVTARRNTRMQGN